MLSVSSQLEHLEQIKCKNHKSVAQILISNKKRLPGLTSTILISPVLSPCLGKLKNFTKPILPTKVPVPCPKVLEIKYKKTIQPPLCFLTSHVPRAGSI